MYVFPERNVGRTAAVNNFGAIGDGMSHPLSERYLSLESAQADYPHATDMVDEIDWCAWQGASNWLYDTAPNLGHGGKNWSAGKIVADGCYLVNRSIVLHHADIIVDGVNQGERLPFGGATSIQYVGPDGADDNHIAILDYYPTDETGNVPDGVFPAFSSGTCRVYNIGLYGKALGGGFDSSPSVTGYVWGIRFRNGSFCEVSHCNFGGLLLDGIVATSQMFMRVSHNFFYGVHRDAVSILGFTGDFSTTVWIDDNEFGLVGRYGLLMNYNGSVEASPSVRRNSFEINAHLGWYHQNPEWYVQGVCAAVCQIGGTYGQYSENRFEAMAGQPAEDYGTYWADMHFVAIGNTNIVGNRQVHIAFGCYRASARTTQAYTDYMAAHKYSDITDERNFHAGYAGDYNGSSQPGGLTIDGCGGFVSDIGGISLSAGALSTWRNATSPLIGLNVPVVNGTYIKRVDPPSISIPSIKPIAGALLQNATELSASRGPFTWLHGEGYPPPWYFGTWAPTVDYRATVSTWDSTAKAKKWVKPLTANGYFYECTVSGTSDADEPAWPTVPGNTVVDGAVTWKCVGTYGIRYANSIEQRYGSRRTAYGTAAPSLITDGYWNRGDAVINTNPSASGVYAWSCVTSGVPGTWKEIAVGA